MTTQQNETRACTWKGCNGQARHRQLDRNKREWADLCDTHHKELEEALNTLTPQPLLKCWVLASGGAEKMAKGITNFTKWEKGL